MKKILLGGILFVIVFGTGIGFGIYSAWASLRVSAWIKTVWVKIARKLE